MRAKAVLFDKDGTLFDFQRTWAPWVGVVIDQLAGGRTTLAADLAQAWGYDADKKKILPESVVISSTVAQVADAVAPLLADISDDQLLGILDAAGAQVNGAEVLPLGPFLTQLSEMGLRLGVATNDSEAAARAQLQRLGVAGQFDFIAGFDSGYGGKPDPAVCLAFCEHIGLSPEQVVMVGDSNHDLAAGRGAGMQTVAVLTGIARADELSALADIVLPDIGHLPVWLLD